MAALTKPSVLVTMALVDGHSKRLKRTSSHRLHNYDENKIKAAYQMDCDDVTEARLDEVASRKPRSMNQPVGADETKQVKVLVLEHDGQIQRF